MTPRGILALAESDAAGPVNIGAPYELSKVELAEVITALSGSTWSIRYVERPVDDPRVRRPDITLARKLLGWAGSTGDAFANRPAPCLPRIITTTALQLTPHRPPVPELNSRAVP